MTTESSIRYQAGVRFAIARWKRVWWASAVLLTTLVVALHGIVLTNQIYLRASDYPTHIAWARGLPDGAFHPGGIQIGSDYRPNALFQLLVYGLAQLPALDFERAALAVSLLASVALALTVHALLYGRLPDRDRSRTGAIATLLALVVLLVGPLYFLTVRQGNLYFGYIAPMVYHNPTVTLLRPFALLLFVFAVRAVVAPSDRSTRSVVIAALLTVAATYAKPNYTLCLLPVMTGVLVLQRLWRRPVDGRLILGGLIVPGIVALGLQYAFAYEANVENSIIFSPLTVARLFEPVHIFPKLALSLVFPAAVVVLYPSRVWRDTALLLAWPVLIVALAYVYLLAEEAVPEHGNFFWGAQVSLFVLFVFSVRCFVQQVSISDGGSKWRNLLCAAALALHFAAGAAWYVTEAVFPRAHW